jgi:enoyl-CoA hydratase/carnithine racemase
MNLMSESADDQIRLETVDGIVVVTFTRDQKLNAISNRMISVLRQAVGYLADDQAARAMVIKASGRYFTAGRDIGDLGPRPDSGVALRHDYRSLHELFDDMEKVEKPVILAAQGPCLGLGVEMGSSCDFRFATPSAVFGLPEIPNLAVVPGSGGISRFTRIVGPHWARWVAMAAETVTAEEAQQMGFIHRILPEDGFAEAVLDWTRKLTSRSVEALGLAKIAIDAAVDSDRLTARRIERVANTVLFHTPEHLAKVEEFNTKGQRD